MKNKILGALIQGKKIISRHYLQFLSVGGLLFGVLWLGYTIRVVGSREISDPVMVVIQAKNNQQLASQPATKLAHAGNVVFFTPKKTQINTWAISTVFIEKLFFVVKKDELPNIDSIRLSIGQKDFNISSTDLVNWRLDNPEQQSAYFEYDKTTEYIAGLPATMYSSVSRLPFSKKVFGNVINWGGDGKLVLNPLISGAKLFILVITALFLYFFLFLLLFPRSPDEPDVLPEREQRIDFLSFVLSLALTLVALFVLSVLIKIFYKPDINIIINQARELYLPNLIGSFVPKPVERMQFVLSVLATPFLLLGFYCSVKSWLKNWAESTVSKLYQVAVPFSVLFIFVMVFWGLAMSDFLYIQNSYFISQWGKYVYAFLLFPLLLWACFSYESNSYLKKIISILPYIFVVLIIFTAFCLNIFSANNIPGGPYHFNPIFYPIAQIFGGKTLLVGFGSLYGLFPIFLNFIFKIIGFSVFKIAAVMGFLIALSYLALFIFLKNTIKNKLVLLGGICSVFFFSYINLPQVYFQYWPIRFFPACIFILAVSLFIKNGNNKFFYYLGFAWSFIAVLWNLETGIVLLTSWALILAYCDFSQVRGMAFMKKSIGHLAVGLGFLLFSAVGLYFYTYLRSGAYPDLTIFYKYQKLFFSGYFMIPMLPPPHIWAVIIFTYLAGLLYSLKSLFVFQSDEKSKIIFFLSILGIGLFSYYEGRSHDATLVGPSYVAVLLFTIFADSLLALVKRHVQPMANMAALILLLFLLFAGPVSLISNVPRLATIIRANFSSLPMADSDIARNITFIKQYSSKTEKIFIISSNYDGVYYTETGTVSAPDLPSSTEYFSKKEVGYIINFLKQNTSTKVFYDVKNPLVFGEEIVLTLKTYYNTKQVSGGGLVLLEKISQK